MHRGYSNKRLIKRHTVTTRLAHWGWAISLLFLLGSGLQIFNAHPVLYIGDQSGFGFDNAVLTIGTEGRAFPAWATIPSGMDLATGRIVHFFFAWVLVSALFLWLLGALVSGHLWRNLRPTARDLRSLGTDIRTHARFQFPHRRTYGPLQKLSYGALLFALFPLIVATGLAMSPGMNAAAPWLPELLGGRQTTRTLHFCAAAALLGFFVLHIVMVVLAGPLNELRAMVTGWYRIDEGE
ncbi:cytochrome b/b6 domain-containing protein [uncultured Roseobacter sp.]|uniref:cytochrome b/b6 domain-containing protein n=1 Tax=uncultured Roseobacter sp. TaxID=114847 RepID=UPI0026235537|nr:cytochrome b/b6 domain-containing protein [uncultured Roseobacter sp.]